MMRKILLPVDLSSPSVHMARKVLEMAKRFNAEIHLLAVGESLNQYATFYVPHPSLGMLEDDTTRGMIRKLEDYRMEHLPDYASVTLAVRIGDPAEQILNYVRSLEIDMVVMATHGLKGLSKALFGSVAEEVAKDSPVPVMIASMNEEDQRWEFIGNIPTGFIEAWAESSDTGLRSS